MRALIQRAYGEPRDVLRLESVSEAPLPAHCARVRVEAVGLHQADLHGVAGREGFRRPLPRTPGCEGVGTVIETGPRVQGLALGDRVLLPLGAGTLRESVEVPEDQLLPVPDGEAAQFALLSINPPTAHLLLEDFVSLAPGDWVIQNAANSNVGRCLIALARARGLRSINIVRREPLMAELESLGGDLVLLDGPELRARVNDATGGAEARLAVDYVGGAATARLADCLADRGVVLSCGCVSGETPQLPFELLHRRELRLQGFNLQRALERRPLATRRRLLQDLAALCAAGQLRTRIAAIYSLETAVEALEHAALTGAARDGKIVVACRS